MNDQKNKLKVASRLAGNHPIEVRPRTWLAPVALALLRERGSHGYGLMERLEGFGFGETSLGTLYRTLRQMENDGLCESGWEISSCGPACRVYSITDAGEAYLASWAERCKEYQRVLASFHQTYTWGRSSSYVGKEAS